MNKTIYILGAGFSIEAGAPSQEKLVDKIFEIHKTAPHVFALGKIDQFERFLSDTMMIPTSLHSRVPLEDIFTPLDRCLIDNLSYRNINIEGIQEIRALIYYLIATTLDYIILSAKKDYIDVFAKHIVKESSTRKDYNYKNTDPISIFSTNWDILLDKSIQSEIDSNYNNDGVLDYCCHISSFWKDERVKPGLEKLGLGGFNVKLLKLHGSLNWLLCPRCNRVYVDLDNKIAVQQYIDPKNCQHCDKHFGSTESHKMISNLIMPTFLKNLLNPQYKLIWQNAGIELSEAKKVVFIGYSLPFADFEMRQLLSRMIQSDAEIEVVDYGKDSDQRIIQTKERYEIFFGERKPKFYLEGASKYIIDKFK